MVWWFAWAFTITGAVLAFAALVWAYFNTMLAVSGVKIWTAMLQQLMTAGVTFVVTVGGAFATYIIIERSKSKKAKADIEAKKRVVETDLIRLRDIDLPATEQSIEANINYVRQGETPHKMIVYLSDDYIHNTLFHELITRYKPMEVIVIRFIFKLTKVLEEQYSSFPQKYDEALKVNGLSKADFLEGNLRFALSSIRKLKQAINDYFAGNIGDVNVEIVAVESQANAS